LTFVLISWKSPYERLSAPVYDVSHSAGSRQWTRRTMPAQLHTDRNAVAPLDRPRTRRHNASRRSLDWEGIVVSDWIAVVDPSPAYRRGIMAILGDVGAEPETPDDLLAWVGRRPRRVIFLTLASDHDWELLLRLRQASAEPIVVAVLSDSSVAAYLRALSAGAAAAVPRDASPERMRQIVTEALHGVSLLPTEVVQALAQTTEQVTDEDRVGLADHEITWLRELASGRTVSELAERSGYSERAMFRLLRKTYARMQVRNRTEALLRARQQGWL
jgi:DNA-binding NarL/FixJ family response regulator